MQPEIIGRPKRAAEILRRVADIKEPRIAEIGVLNGKLSEMLLAARDDLHLVMVDNWLHWQDQPLPYIATGDTSALCTRPDAVEAAARKVARKYAGRANIIKGDSANVAVPGLFDLVFLDGDHSARGVRRDIEAWRFRVKPGGWLGGHDYDNPAPNYDFSGVKLAVDAAFPEIELGENYTWWAK